MPEMLENDLRECRLRDAGRMDYRSAQSLQEELAGARRDDLVPDSVIRVEHSPVVTTGRFRGEDHLLRSRAELEAAGVEFVASDRGGDVTYHGPGQIVLYPILKLRADERSVDGYMRRLEEVGIRTLAAFGLRGERVDGMTGVWVNGRKIQAIGVRLSRWVTQHGLAFNVDVDLEPFSYIVPCGLSGREVTSLERELGRPISTAEVAPVLERSFEEVFDRKLTVEPSFAHEATEQERNWRRERPNRLPPWLKMKLPFGDKHVAVDRAVHERRLNTVCESARCPNLGECWGEHRTATFMILGNRCTRFCRFCSVPSGRPEPWEEDEPRRVAEAAAELGLRYVVVTSVDRDDLPDLGAGAFARTIFELRAAIPGVRVEVLTPDFRGRADCVRTVLDAEPDIFAHNLETVPSRYRYVRPGSHYYWSLGVLREAARSGRTHVKTSLMLGLGETSAELVDVLADARDAGVEVVTLGQYLRPTSKHHEVVRFLPPSEFAAWKRHGEAMGIRWVEAGPLVRSSYHAAEQSDALGSRAGSAGASPGPGGWPERASHDERGAASPTSFTV